MDLRLSGARATDAEREAVDGLLGPPTSSWDGAEARGERDLRTSTARRDRRDLLLPALHALQDRVGWISRGALDYACMRLGVAPADAYGVATFYHLLSVAPQPPTVAYVCDDIACRIAGARDSMAELERSRGAAGTSRDGAWTWRTASCLGHCDRAPAVLVRRSGVRPRDLTLAPASAAEIIACAEREALPEADGDAPRLAAYRASGGFAGLARAREIGPEAVLREVAASKLVGRGGAAFPVAAKWQAVAAGERPRYLVCNADESEPGAFKDRMLMEERPFAVVEGLAIAAHAIGAERAYLYIRGEYPLALERMRSAISEARGAGLLDGLDPEIRRGAGAYICGEETALFNSIEGRRGEPRDKPPYPASHGLFGRPTAVNNVETLAYVPGIVVRGGAAFASVGTPASTGMKLFSVSGRVRRPGVYEVPFGETVRDLITRAGGVREGRALRAVLVGGAAGSFLRPDEIDAPLTLEGMRAAGAELGSGVVMVFDDTVDLADVVLRIAAFFRGESCGQCVPCRIGTVRQEEALRRYVRAPGQASPELSVLDDLARVMRDASICGLGRTASTAVGSALQKLDLGGGKTG